MGLNKFLIFLQGGKQVGFCLKESMAEIGAEFKKGLRGRAVFLIALLFLACGIVSAQEDLEQVIYKGNEATKDSKFGSSTRIISFLKHSGELLSKPVWPVRYLFIF